MTVYAHCDGPCGVYDPASTRVAAEAVLSMTKKLIALEAPSSTDSAALTTWGELNWLKIVNETQKTKTAKLIKTSFT